MSGQYLYWYAWSFAAGNTQGSVYVGYVNTTLTKKRILEAKLMAKMPQDSVLIAVSYLGHMTKKDFESETP